MYEHAVELQRNRSVVYRDKMFQGKKKLKNARTDDDEQIMLPKVRTALGNVVSG